MWIRRVCFAVPFLLLALFVACRSGSTSPKVDPEDSAASLVFQDITKASGIDFSYRNGEETANHLSILESLGSGAALLDIDGDGLLDVYMPGGGHYAGKDMKDIVGVPGKLYRNLGKNQFEDVTAKANLTTLASGRPWFYSHAAAVGDYDRDGKADLLVTGWGRVALFRNVGGKFEDVSEKAGLLGAVEWGVSAAFADLDGDGFPDLYVTQYVNWSWSNNPAWNYGGGQPDVSPPRHYSGLVHKIFRNTGKGSFVDCTKEVGLRAGAMDQSKGLGVIIADLNLDGKPDIYVCNDTTENFLYINESKRGQLKFREQGMRAGVARDEAGTPNGSMGVDIGDPERSGRPALWVTNYENELHGLYLNECRPGLVVFNYATQTAGIAALGQTHVGWGTNFVDVDLDGWEDLYISNGHAIRYPTAKGVYRKQKPVLLMNEKGKFKDQSRRIGEFAKVQRLGRGVAFGDLDNDGRIDLISTPTNEPASVLRGIGGEGKNWVGFRLLGHDHACVVGSRVVIETSDGAKQTRFTKAGGSYASSGDPRLAFGLDTATIKSARVIWADGQEQEIRGVKENSYHEVRKEK